MLGHQFEFIVFERSEGASAFFDDGGEKPVGEGEGVGGFGESYWRVGLRALAEQKNTKHQAPSTTEDPRSQLKTHERVVVEMGMSSVEMGGVLDNFRQV